MEVKARLGGIRLYQQPGDARVVLPRWAMGDSLLLSPLADLRAPFGLSSYSEPGFATCVISGRGVCSR